MANQGRPVCRTGKSAACKTAKSVIASAKRLMLVRHFCWKRSRMALISVPAWPIPIHQTKLVMPNAQATGMLLPHIPMPLATVTTTASVSTPVPAMPMRKSASQPRSRRLPDVGVERLVERAVVLHALDERERPELGARVDRGLGHQASSGLGLVTRAR